MQPEHNDDNNLVILHTIPEEQADYFEKLGVCDANAVQIGTHIDIKALTGSSTSRFECVVIQLSLYSLALIYRYGAIMFFNASVNETASLIARCQQYTTNFSAKPETERFQVIINPNEPDGIKDGKLWIQHVTKQRLEVIGSGLSKSVTLDYQEHCVSALFERVEPIAKHLSETGKLSHSAKELLQHIGATLMMTQEMMGRVQITEKPSLLWDRPQLETLYQHLVDDLELTERQEILNQKIQLIAKTAETSLDILEHRHSHRLEWYIIVLIAIEILLQLYDLFIR